MVLIEDCKFVGNTAFCKACMEAYEGQGEIISIYFLPEYMGKGYGKKLMDAALFELKKQGFSQAYLWVLEDNANARHFFGKVRL